MAEYIKREEAINLLWLYADESCASVVSDFESLPAADVAEVRHGRWVDEYPVTGLYCPNCGARMGKEDEHD